MRCKFFNVPLGSGATLDFEQKISDFVSATNVKHVFASIANTPEGPAWSVLFFYEGEMPSTQITSPASTVSASCERPAPNAVPNSGPPLTRDEVKFIMALKKWRADAAASEGVPLYMVAHNRWLEEMVRMPVSALDDLKKISGFGEWRVKKYGAKIIEIMNTAGKNSLPTASYSASRT